MQEDNWFHYLSPYAKVGLHKTSNTTHRCSVGQQQNNIYIKMMYIKNVIYYEDYCRFLKNLIDATIISLHIFSHI